MGLFRVYKVKHYSIDDAIHQENCYIDSITRLMKQDVDWRTKRKYLESYMQKWAEWRELRARLENENDSDVV